MNVSQYSVFYSILQKMDLHLKVLYIIAMLSYIVTAIPLKVNDNNLNCTLCDPGYRLKKACDALNGPSQCVPCQKGFFMEEPNNKSQCKECRHACPYGSRQVAGCNSTQNMECRCPTGQYMLIGEGYNPTCMKYTTCLNGSVIEPGTPWKDVVCSYNVTNTTDSIPTTTTAIRKPTATTQKPAVNNTETYVPSDTAWSVVTVIPVGGIILILFIGILLWKKKRCRPSVCLKTKPKVDPEKHHEQDKFLSNKK